MNQGSSQSAQAVQEQGLNSHGMEQEDMNPDFANIFENMDQFGPIGDLFDVSSESNLMDWASIAL